MEYNLADLHDAVSAAIPDRECIVWRDRRLTYAQVAERTNRLANHLDRRGPRRPHASAPSSAGTRAARTTSPATSTTATSTSRRCSAPTRPGWRRSTSTTATWPRSSATCSTTPAPRAIVFHSAFADRLAEVLPDLPALTVLLQVDDGSGADLLPGAEWYEDALAAASPDRPDVERSPDDLYILYTGGTTGMPKGVLWRQADIYVGALGGRNLGTGAEWDERRRGRGGRPQRRRPPAARAAVHARRRPLAGLQRHERRQHDLHPGRHRRPRPRRRLAHHRAGEGQHPADRRRRLRPPARRPARGGRRPRARPTTCRRCSWSSPAAPR